MEAPQDFVAFGEDAWRADRPPEERGIRVLGAPLGCTEYVDKFAVDLVEEEAQLLDLLLKLPSLQAGWLLLYFCAVPRINHLLRTTSPMQLQRAARLHDQCMVNTFRQLFQIPDRCDWDATLHGVAFETWVLQAQLPLRLGGCGLRNASRTAYAAYWASWTDSLPVLLARFPPIGHLAVRTLSALQALDADKRHDGPECLTTAELAGKQCASYGWDARPLWIDIAAGLAPPNPPLNELTLGEWRHGWQFHASNPIELHVWSHLLRLPALPSTRSNAAATGKARLHSCMGPYASTWLTVCPTSDALKMDDSDMWCAVRRRLGIAVCFEGPDVHGYGSLTRNLMGRLNSRHRWLIAAWRQVFVEAGGDVPDDNVERLLRETHVPVRPEDLRRLDLMVPGLNVARGLPLFCDVTCVTPISGTGLPRGGTSNRGGRLLELAQEDNDDIYHEVRASGLGALRCLGCEVYGRWGQQCVELVPALARERCRGVHPRLRRGMTLSLQHRWWGVLGVALQRSVARLVLNPGRGGNLPQTQLEPASFWADLAVV